MDEDRASESVYRRLFEISDNGDPGSGGAGESRRREGREMHRGRLPRRLFLRLAGGAAGAAGLTYLGQTLAGAVQAAAPAAPLATFPDPGRVTGDIRVHDPSLVRAPDGTYVLVHTGDNLAIKTSTDRIAWRGAGVVWPNGAP